MDREQAGAVEAQTGESAAKAAVEAVEVIEDSYADEGETYRLGASCSNCGWEGEVRRNKGYPPRFRYACPRCGCNEAKPRFKDYRGADPSTGSQAEAQAGARNPKVGGP